MLTFCGGEVYRDAHFADHRYQVVE